MRLKIATSLYVFGGLIAVAVIAGALFAGNVVNKVRVGGELFNRISDDKDFIADILPPPLYIVEAYLMANLAVRNVESVAVMKERFAKLHKDYDARMAHWRASDLHEALKAKLEGKADKASQAMWQAIEQVLLPALGNIDSFTAEKALWDLDKIYKEQRGIIDELVNDASVMQAKLEARTARELSTALYIGAAILIVLLAIIAIGVVFLNRMAIRPLSGLLHPLGSIAEGNFTVDVPGRERHDEVGQIAAAVAALSAKVSGALSAVKNSGREVTNASAEIATSTIDLSKRIEEQAASLEETSSAVEELSATVRKNAENARQASSDADVARSVADRGGEVVSQAVSAMARIEESSRKISDIIGVIDEIARQTNLLALNAAVEAARAGEAGRGFAVVASEVRSLAQRSSQAAKDIKDLITNSNGQVKDGVELVNRAGESLTGIVESIQKVAAVVSDIANASVEQATGIDQINRALSQMDEVTQKNSALVEENAATAKTLENQAKMMDEQVAVFQIAAGHDVRAVAATRAVVASTARVAKPVARAASAPAVKSAPARQMQTALAKAVNGDDWKEF